MLPGQIPKPQPQARPNGQAPPKEADPNEVWSRFSQLPRPLSAPHIFRARGVEVGTLVFRVLTAGELTSVYVKAHGATDAQLGADSKGSTAYEEVYQNEKGIELIQLACRQPDSPLMPVFVNTKDVRENLTDDEIGVLLAAYSIFRTESGPILQESTPEEMEAWISLLEKGASAAPLAHCSSDHRTALLMFAVSKLRAVSSTATSSAGSQPEGPSTQSSSDDESSAPPADGTIGGPEAIEPAGT
jgi:hypothetical protein